MGVPKTMSIVYVQCVQNILKKHKTKLNLKADNVSLIRPQCCCREQCFFFTHLSSKSVIGFAHVFEKHDLIQHEAQKMDTIWISWSKLS